MEASIYAYGLEGDNRPQIADEKQMTVADMKENITRVENLAKRGLLSPQEAERKISSLIDETLPEETILDEKIWRRMEQRRLAKRREWRFLLSMTKESLDWR